MARGSREEQEHDIMTCIHDEAEELKVEVTRVEL